MLLVLVNARMAAKDKEAMACFYGQVARVPSRYRGREDCGKVAQTLRDSLDPPMPRKPAGESPVPPNPIAESGLKVKACAAPPRRARANARQGETHH